MLLSVDTSTRMVGVALYNSDHVLGEMLWYSRNYHTVELAPAIETLLARCSSKPRDLQALGVALGPGSFTGLRIGLALIKGMAQALNIPVIGIPTLEVLAAAQPVQEKNLVAVLQAGRGRLAAGWYKASEGRWVQQGILEVLTAAELVSKIDQPTLVCGELEPEEQRILARKYRNVQLVSAAHAVRHPSYLAELAWRRWKSGEVDDAASLTPIYLHSGDEIEG
jgi:tRNA threonylcarbamoyladenosine biosynthesis protein TsaB